MHREHAADVASVRPAIRCHSIVMCSDLILTDGFVLLRRYRDSDANAVYAAVRESISDLSPWFAWCHTGYSLEETKQFLEHQREWWREGRVYNFAITDAPSGAYLGGCLLNNINRGNRFANLAYWVRSGWTSRGVATASSRLVAGFGFEHLGLNRVEIVAAKENLASIRVAEKAGAKREGELRSRITVRNNVYDAVLFSLIPEDLEE
jgi:ribosomal-protein-serine acetyltransferase